MSIPVLETERLRLRPWRDDDLDPYAALCADAEVMRWLGGPKSRAETADQLATFARHWDEHGFGLWCVAPKETDDCVGFIGLAIPTFLPEILPAVEVGWRLARPSWGHGFATEGARCAVAFGFEMLDLDRIVSVTRPENRSSWNVMEKLGMTLERTTTHPEHGWTTIVYELPAP